ncbi:MAG: hypothetical protein HYR95_01195, partial [Candidatus Colwellbacteria bacterium]|nr:hypothetical protein [Candidatus Colwellbacteria bacterium]
QNVLSLRPEEFLQRIGETNLENASDVLIARDISLKQAIDLKSATFESLRVNDEYRRHYLSDAFSAVTGFVGYSEKDRLLSGRAGIEAYYDDILRGEDGKRITYRDALGRTKSAEAVKEPKQDSPVKTTIDYDFQEYFYGRLLRGLNSLGRTGGVGLALNPQNGEVLALLSFPSFDANNVSKYLNDSGRPLFNRVVGGVYTPGSTIKPVHAVAALKEGVITPQGKIFSAGYIEIPNPYNPETPSRFLDWKPHGLVDSHSALARSSNVYFYEVIGGFGGLKGVGVDKLKDYWQKFGFGRLAGIDLPGEASGFLPDPEEKEKRTGSPWRVGDTYNVAIGQGDISMTPLQLMDAIVAIANGGKTFAPHIKLDSGNSPPKIIFDVSELEPELKEVRVGMEDAVSKPYGTANLLSSLPFTVAAKTGSSQTANNTKTNALFVGYAPTENPQIAILVLIEDAKEGSLNAVPIANDVLRWYYENRIRSNVNK